MECWAFQQHKQQFSKNLPIILQLCSELSYYAKYNFTVEHSIRVFYYINECFIGAFYLFPLAGNKYELLENYYKYYLNTKVQTGV